MKFLVFEPLFSIIFLIENIYIEIIFISIFEIKIKEKLRKSICEMKSYSLKIANIGINEKNNNFISNDGNEILAAIFRTFDIFVLE